MKAELSAVTNELSGVKADNVFLREDVERLEAALTKSRELYIGLLGRRMGVHDATWSVSDAPTDPITTLMKGDK